MRIAIVGQKWLGERLLMSLMPHHEIVAVAAPVGDRLFIAANNAGVAVLGTSMGVGMIPDGVELIVAAHAHQFIHQSIRAKAKHGAIGYHPSLLPLHRGRDAVRWAIHMREQITGGTVYRMDDGADTGDIILQQFCFIRPDDTAETLWRRDLAPLGIRLLTQAVAQIADGTATYTPQDKALATFEPSFVAGKLGGAR